MTYAIQGQTLTVRATLGVDLTGASSVLVHYKPPLIAEGTVSGIVDTPATGALHGTISAATLMTLGDWTFWVSAILSSGNTIKTFGTLVRVVSDGAVIE